MSSHQKDPLIRVLRLSRRPYNCLRRAGIDTVGQLALLSDEQLLGIRELGVQSLAEIKRKLQVYLSRYPLGTGASYDTDGAVSPSPGKVASVFRHRPQLEGTALEALGLSVRPYNALTRRGIKTVEQLVAMSDEQITAVRNIGTKSLTEIRKKLEAYLIRDSSPAQPPPRVREPEPPSPFPPMVNPQVLELASERDIPLDRIRTERLALSQAVESLLHRAGIRTIGALARQPRDKWQANPIVQQRLPDYLDWLIEQNEDVWANEQSGRGLNPLHRLALAETTLEVLATSWLSVLSDRRRDIIRWRYGFDGEPLTLDDIGKRIGVSRERVRQILAKALGRLSHHVRRNQMDLVKLLLIHLLEDAGGVMSERQIEAALRREMIVGDVDPVTVSRLVFEAHSDFKRLRAGLWGLTGYPLAEVDAVQNEMTRVLERAYAPLPAKEMISRFKETLSYRDRQDKLSEALITACLRTHPDLLCGTDGSYGLKRWERSRLDEIVRALREIGEPAHYTAIAEKANAMLDPGMRTSARNIHAILDRRKDLFVWTGKRGTYGLQEWGLEEPLSYEEALVRILESAERPLALEEILARFPDVRPHYNENSVSMTLMINDCFRAYPDSTYGLSSWDVTDKDIEQRSLAPDFVGTIKERVFEQLSCQSQYPLRPEAIKPRRGRRWDPARAEGMLVILHSMPHGTHSMARIVEWLLENQRFREVRHVILGEKPSSAPKAIRLARDVCFKCLGGHTCGIMLEGLTKEEKIRHLLEYRTSRTDVLLSQLANSTSADDFHLLLREPIHLKFGVAYILVTEIKASFRKHGIISEDCRILHKDKGAYCAFRDVWELES